MIQARTRRQVASEWLRGAILDGTYKAGDRLKQEEIAKRLGCSAIPVREALQQLATEGFVVADPQRGSRVREFSSRNLREIYEVRTLLEGLAVRRAAKRFTPADGLRIRSILGKMDRTGISAEERVQFNWEFHDNLYALADQEFLFELISHLRRAIEPYLRMDVTKVANWKTGQRDHRRILEACMRRDANAAAKHTVAHIRRTGNRLIKYVSGHWK